jgi:UMF1 family MFS transporter
MLENPKSRSVFGWVMYDWANSAFALTVLAAFFPVFFRQYWCFGMESSFTTTKLGFANAAAGILAAFMAPILGALADAGRMRKLFLVFFMIVGALLTAFFPLIGRGAWVPAIILFVFANFCWTGANLFYDSLLTVVADRENMDWISSVGFSTGYAGCAILFFINILMVSKPQMLGLHNASTAIKASFVTVSAWWMVFSIPLILFVKENANVAGERNSSIIIIKNGFRSLKKTAREIIKIRRIWLFLVAYWLYIDGVDTFIRMAADLGLSIGLDAKGLMISLLLVQIAAFPSALLFGYISKKTGAGYSLLAGICIYLVITIAGPLWVKTAVQYRIMAVLSALPLGCLQALSRSHYAKLVPPERAAEFFGFYNLMGKFAAIIGPVIVAVVAYIFETNGLSTDTAARLGFCSISVLFATGAVLLVLSGVKNERAFCASTEKR